jgi:hypothetical protein
MRPRCGRPVSMRTLATQPARGVGHSVSCSLPHVVAGNSRRPDPDATPTEVPQLPTYTWIWMCHISRKVITHFFQFSHLGYRPTVYCVRDVVGPHPCEHWQLYSHWRGGQWLLVTQSVAASPVSSLATHVEPTPTRPRRRCLSCQSTHHWI